MQKYEPQIEVIPQETVDQLILAVRCTAGIEDPKIIAQAINQLLNRQRIEKHKLN